MPTTDCLTELLAAAGALRETAAGRQEVVSFGDSAAEYAALANTTGLVALPDRTQVELTGRDRASFLHSFCTNDIRSLAPGQGREAFICNVQGKLAGHGLVFCREESLVLESTPGQAEKLIQHLDRYLIREQVELHDRSHDWQELLLAGPQAESLLAALNIAPLPGERLSHGKAFIGGCQVQVRRVDFVRPPALLLSMESSRAAAVWRTLLDAGARPCGWQAWEAARIEAGWPWYGQDMNDENLPQELARDTQAISFVKGCYLGQETVARIDALGHVNKLLCRLRFATATPPAAGTVLFNGEKEVGRITSAAFSPGTQASVALGYLRRGSHQPGQAVESAVGPGEVM
ncbi:MAG: folate-binding protein YgfZ [Pirellulales bacterium]